MEFYVDGTTTTPIDTPYQDWKKQIKPNAQQGWVCPKCGRVNAPWVGTCPCYIDNYKINFVN